MNNTENIASMTRTLQNTAWVASQRATLIVCGLLFVVVVPRLMGVLVYGRFALLIFLSSWSIMLSTLGLVRMLSRYLPEQLVREEYERARTLFGNALTVRVLVAVPVAVGYVLIAGLVVPDADLLTRGLAGGMTLVWSINGILFSLPLGHNQAARWGFSFLARRWLILLIAPVGYLLGGLPGAMAGLFAIEILLLCLGIYWARSYIRIATLRIDPSRFAPFFRFGLTLFPGSIMHATFRNIGAVLVGFACVDPAQVGFFSASFGIYLAAEAACFQIVQSLVPFLSELTVRGQHADVRRWAETLIRSATVLAMPALFGSLFLAHHAVALLFGHDYLPMARNLWPIALLLLAIIPAAVASLLAVVLERPGSATISAAVRLGVFLGISLPLTARHGSFGTCLALVAATSVYVVFFYWQLRTSIRLPWRRWAAAIVTGSLFTPLVMLRGSLISNVALFLFSTCTYAVLVMVLGIIARAEIRNVWGILRRR